MAARVNTKFVVGLVGALVIVMTGVMLVGYKAVQRSGDDLVAEGDKFAAAGEWEKAAGAYGRAVNKNQRNAPWIEKWLAALEKTTPQSSQGYMDRYFKEYRSGLRALAESDRANLANFRRVLDEHVMFVYLQGGQMGAWEQMGRLADDLLKIWRGDEQGKKVLRGYRGMATVGAYRGNPDVKEDDLKPGYEDLLAGIEAEPKNEQVVMNAAVMELMLAEAASRRADEAASEAMLTNAHDRLAKFVEDNPPAPFAAFQQVIVENTVMQKPKAAKPAGSAEDDGEQDPRQAEMARIVDEKIKPIIRTLKSMPPESIESHRALDVAFVASALLRQGMDNLTTGPAVAVDLLEHVRKGHPKDSALLLFTGGVLARGQGDYDLAEQQFKQVVALEPIPLSLQGAMLRERRAQAISELLTIAFARWELAEAAEAKEKALAEAQTLRAQLTEFVSESSNAVLAADARIELMKGNFMGARALATRYNDQTNRADIDMLAIEAEILRRMGNTGAAKDIYTRILQRQPTSLVAILRMAEIETGAGNYAEARRYMNMAANLRKDLKELREKVRILDQMTRNEVDPETQVLKRAQEKVQGIARDVPGGIQILREGLVQFPDSVMLTRALAVLYMQTGMREDAKKLLDHAIAVMPTGVDEFQRWRDALERPAKEVGIEQIDKLPIQDWQKDLARYEVYLKSGEAELARKHLEAALKARPDDPLVVEMAFQDAATRTGRAGAQRRAAETAGNEAEAKRLGEERAAALAECERLAGVAEQKNLDQVNGLLFRARVDILKGNREDAIRSLREAVSKDKVSLLGWRLLGMMLLESGQYQAASDALAKAVEISPTDLLSAKDYVKALFATKRLAEALSYARRVEAHLGVDAEFAEMLLQLETLAPTGDPTRAIEIRTNLAGQNPPDLKDLTEAQRTNLYQLIALLIDDKQFDKAQAHISRFLQADPMNVVAVQLQSALHGKQGNKEAAMKDWTDYIGAIKPEDRNEDSYIRASMAMEDLGWNEAAVMLLNMGKKYQDPKERRIDRQLGDMAFRANKYEEAVAAYRDVVENADPEEAKNVRKRIVEALIRMRQYAKAEEEIKAFGAEAQKDATILLLAAENAAQQGDKAKARRIYDQVIALQPKNPMAFLKRADLFRSDPAMQREVEQDYLQVLQLEPQYNPARARLAALYAESGRTDQAIEQFRQAVERAPEDDAVRIAYIDLLVQRGRAAEAVQAVEEIVKLRPTDAQWLFKGATLAARAGSPDRAAEYFGVLWKNRPGPDTAYYYARALLNKQPPDMNTANEVLQSPSVNEEQSIQLRLVRARLNRLKQRMADASKGVLDALAMVNPAKREDAQAFIMGLEDVYPKQDEIIAALSRLEEKAPFREWLGFQANVVRMRDPASRPQVKAAMEALANTSSDTKIKGAAYGLLGTIEMGSDNWTGAAEAFRKGSEADPDNAELLNNYAYLSATKLNRPQDALDPAEKAVKLVPNSANFLDTLASVHLKLKNCDRAAELLAQAITVSTHDGERAPVLMHTAQARHCQGNRPEAKRLLQLVEQIFTGIPDVRQNYETDLKELHKQIDGF